MLPDALYYLRNFRQAIDWVVERNHDLLSQEEREFAVQFGQLPVCAQALLARLSIRQGVLFRHSKIRYAEIEPLDDALDALMALGWVDARPQLALADVFRFATHAELTQAFGMSIGRMTKSAAYESLIDEHRQHRAYQAWLRTDEAVYHVVIAPIVQQFRLLHFGNFHQAWHEYTLAHLQIFKYELVILDPASRPFESREQIEFFYALYGCYEAMGEGAELSELLARLPEAPPTQDWLRRAWDRLRFGLGQAAERAEDYDAALALYRNNGQIDARVRGVRLLECLNRDEEALSTARALLADGGSERMVEHVTRVVSRIERRRGVRSVKVVTPPAWITSTLSLVQDPDLRVEALVRAHLSRSVRLSSLSDEDSAHVEDVLLDGPPSGAGR